MRPIYVGILRDKTMDVDQYRFRIMIKNIRFSRIKLLVEKFWHCSFDQNKHNYLKSD